MNFKKTLRTILLAITPTFLYPIIRRIVTSSFAHYLDTHTSISFFSPTWNMIQSGPFAGIYLYYDSTSTFWSKEAQEGMHDKDIFSFLLKINLQGKTVFDIGAHIGLNSLCYAKMVGQNGRVIAFEPNSINRDRMRINLSHNLQLKKIITISALAISNKNGSDDFFMTNAIEDGTSSGSVIGSIKDTSEKLRYENEYGFKRMKVRTSTLDSFVTKTRIHPDLIKIDVEGAETLVLEGALKTIQKYKPLILIELHTILNGHTVTALLSRFSYTFTVLRTESDGRTFIAAISNEK